VLFKEQGSGKVLLTLARSCLHNEDGKNPFAQEIFAAAAP
jgi:hypothetical protein